MDEEPTYMRRKWSRARLQMNEVQTLAELCWGKKKWTRDWFCKV